MGSFLTAYLVDCVLSFWCLSAVFLFVNPKHFLTTWMETRPKETWLKEIYQTGWHPSLHYIYCAYN